MYLPLSDCVARFTEEWPGEDGPGLNQNAALLQTWAFAIIRQIGVSHFCERVQATFPVVDGGFAQLPQDCMSVLTTNETGGISRFHSATGRLYVSGRPVEASVTYERLPLDEEGRLLIPELAEEAVIAGWKAKWAMRLNFDRKTRQNGYGRDYQLLKAEADTAIGYARGQANRLTPAQRQNLLDYRNSLIPGNRRRMSGLITPSTDTSY